MGKGATFIFTVKVEHSKNNTDTEDNHSEEGNTSNRHSKGEFYGKKLLVAEDIEINREILVALLEDSGLIIECAENGQEALDMISANQQKYDIILMDIQMPQMDGLEATRKIRALPAHQCKNLPIIAMTANVFKEDIEACVTAGMNDHISKPLDIDRVLDVLRKYLKRR